jgi:hypothetical protein
VKARVVVEKPKEATAEEWKDSQDRAERAVRYAAKMPEHVRPSEVRFQNAEWQWWSEYRHEDRMEYAPEAEPVVLVKRKCEACEGTWSSSVEMECPYCHGKGRKAA